MAAMLTEALGVLQRATRNRRRFLGQLLVPTTNALEIFINPVMSSQPFALAFVPGEHFQLLLH